jgi:hypothetical protein
MSWLARDAAQPTPECCVPRTMPLTPSVGTRTRPRPFPTAGAHPYQLAVQCRHGALLQQVLLLLQRLVLQADGQLLQPLDRQDRRLPEALHQSLRASVVATGCQGAPSEQVLGTGVLLQLLASVRHRSLEKTYFRGRGHTAKGPTVSSQPAVGRRPSKSEGSYNTGTHHWHEGKPLCDFPYTHRARPERDATYPHHRSAEVVALSRTRNRRTAVCEGSTTRTEYAAITTAATWAPSP